MRIVFRWSAALAAALILSSAASAQNVEFRGGGYSTDAVGCEPIINPGEQIFVRARFGPAGVGGNDSSSRLTIFFPLGTFSFLLRDASFDGSFRVAEGQVIGLQALDLEPNPRVRFDRQLPARIRPNTRDVYVEATMRRFLGIPGCSIRFSLGLLRAP